MPSASIEEFFQSFCERLLSSAETLVHPLEFRNIQPVVISLHV